MVVNWLAILTWFSQPVNAVSMRVGRCCMLAANWSQRWELDVRFRTKWSTLKRAWHGSLHNRGTINLRHPRSPHRNHTYTHPVKGSYVHRSSEGIICTHIQWKDHMYTYSVKGSHVHTSSEGITCTHNHWRNNILAMGEVARSVPHSLSFTSNSQTNFLIPMLLGRINPGLSGWENTSCHGWGMKRDQFLWFTVAVTMIQPVFPNTRCAFTLN